MSKAKNGRRLFGGNWLIFLTVCPLSASGKTQPGWASFSGRINALGRLIKFQSHTSEAALYRQWRWPLHVLTFVESCAYFYAPPGRVPDAAGLCSSPVPDAPSPHALSRSPRLTRALRACWNRVARLSATVAHRASSLV